MRRKRGIISRKIVGRGDGKKGKKNRKATRKRGIISRRIVSRGDSK